MAIKILTISGPSGTGKTTLAQTLLKTYPGKFRLLVGLTTRPEREDEIGEYQFVSEEEFISAAERNELWNNIDFHGHHYGIPLKEMEYALSSEKTSLRIISPDAAKMFQDTWPGQVLSIFLRPHSREEMRCRLIARGDSPIDVERRIMDIRWEGEYADATHFSFIDPGSIERTASKVVELVL